MPWQDRLKEAAYTSPSGTRLTFQYVDVRRNFEKKTSGFQFPDSDNTLVQDNGVTSYQFPLRLFFSGDDYDLQILEFENILRERGVGKLEHPVYGVFDVVPFGRVTRRDDLVTAGNQGILEVTFWQTVRNAFPIGQVDPAAAVAAAVGEFNTQSGESFEQSVSLDSAVEQTNFQNSYETVLSVTRSNLQDIANSTAEVQAQFDAIYESINIGLETLVGDPLTLGLQTLQLIQSPGRAAASIQSKLEVYSSLTNSIVDQTFVEFNNFVGSRLFGNGYVSGAIVSALNTTFETKPQALVAAENLLNLFDQVNTWSESNFDQFGVIDTGEDYQQLQEAVALTAGFLVELSFDLREERSIVIDRNRTIIDLAGELYGEVDPQLDFLITSNNLSGSEILELPKGKEIVYYA